MLRIRAILLTALILGGGIWFLQMVSGILLPFVVGLMLAYLLNPVADYFEECGLPRPLGSAIPVALAISLIVILMMLGVPMLTEQLTSFAQRLPVYLMTLQHFVLPAKLAKVMHLQFTLDALLKPIGMIGAQGAEWTVQALQKTLNGFAWLVNMALLIVMTPLVAYYLLIDWPTLFAKAVTQLPKRWRSSVREMADEIDVKLAAYLRGTLAVCLTMGLYYAIGLSLVGLVASWLSGQEIESLELAWAIGLTTGLLAFLPVIGASIGFFAMMLMALVQYQLGAWEPYLLIAGLFFVGQSLEGYVLSPLLVGNRVGLHPLWVMFALLAGGALGGIIGMLLSIPVAVVISVVLPRIMKQWRSAVD